MKEYNLDAKNKKLGRFSSEIAVLLMGKNEPDFARNKVSKLKINVSNLSELDISQKKKDTKKYDSYSGYPGGRKEFKMSDIIEKKGYGEVLKKAVFGMLPNNRLRKEMMKNLIIKD